MSELRSKLDSGDLTAAARLAHQVKGVSGNLGLLALSAAAADLEKTLQDKDASGSSVAAVQDKFEREIEAALTETRVHLQGLDLLEADLVDS